MPRLVINPGRADVREIQLKPGAGMVGGGIALGSLIRYESLRSGMPWSWWGLMIQVFVLGYLFAYMQNIIHSTAVEDPEMPALPSMANFWEDILLPCLQLLGLTLFCFAPAIALGWWAIASEQSSLVVVIVASLSLGGIYFPMAFLAVAMLDSVAAANPLKVVPSILKAPLEYLATLALLAGVLAVRTAGDFILPILFPRGIATHSIPKLLGFFGAQALWSLASLYLLTVAMHILGLLYVTKKDKLGWLSR